MYLENIISFLPMIYTAMLVTRIASWNKNALIYDEDFPMRDTEIT